MSRVILIARMALGGAICGGFLGVLAGTAAGAVFGACRGDVSLGLDGALFGGGILALAGALYGFVLELTEDGPEPGFRRQDWGQQPGWRTGAGSRPDWPRVPDGQRPGR